MCGIVGARDDWLRRRGLPPAAAMHAAVAALGWRGPDGQRVVRAGAWWLGCARLAIGPARAAQPVVQRSGRHVGVLNGAITNARELWARLLPGAERRAVLPNDAWLPLLAVARGERALLATLRGHHAFAVVDTVTGELVTGRDRYGEKPLVCLHDTGAAGRPLLAFASTAPALAAFGVPALRRPRRRAEWFRCGFHDPLPRRLPGRLVLAHHAPAAPPAAATATDLRAALVGAVRGCVDTPVPVGLLLSGGIDSSCLAASLGALGRRVPAYQFRANGEPAAERDVARAVAARCGLDLRPVDGGTELLDALPRLTALAGTPLGDPSVLAVHATAVAAAADGVRVLLGGEGADERHLGYRRYRAFARLPDLRWLRALAPRWSMHPAARWLRAATAPEPWLALLAVTPPAFGSEVLAPALAQRRCWRDDAPQRCAGRSAAARLAFAQAHDLAAYLPLDLLPKVDLATLAAGVEARCPFLDGTLPDAHDADALGKRRLRDAFAAHLPAAVFRQPKRGFALPLDRWFRAASPWLDLLAEPRSRGRPHLRPGGLAGAVDRHRSGRSNLGHGLYLLLAYELFLRLRDRESGPDTTNPPGRA
ncbi:MAG: asparagine synthetase B [Planctomycetes bacterium]|nr:asparagine synthetase B [Planctomycetota bacterium]